MQHLHINSKTLASFTSIAILFAVIFTSFSTPVFATAGINQVINFQGKVVNKTAGTNVSNGSHDFIFKVYDAASSGTLLWEEQYTAAKGTALTVTDGIFRAPLGSICVFSAATCQTVSYPGVDFNSDSLYLDITFDAETMGSRVQFTSVPYAFNAQKVSGLTVTNNGGNTLNIAANKTFTVNENLTLSGTTGKTLTLNGSTTLADNVITFGGTETLTLAATKNVSFADAFSTSGSFPLTLTSTGSTNVTLPTSGTLATTSQLSFTLDTTNGQIFPTQPYSSVYDVLFGGSSTSSAKFGFTNIATANPTATFAGNLVFSGARSVLGTAYSALNIGDTNTGNITIAAGSGKIITTSNQLSAGAGISLGGAITGNSNNITGVGNLTASTSQFGTTPASAGIIAIPNNSYINARNAANNGDINLIKVDSSNLVAFGANTAAFTLGGAITGNSQNITGVNNLGSTNLTITGTLTANGSTGTGQCLMGGATASWGTCGGSSSWYDVGGALFPTVIANDLLLGGSATTSARFSVLGIKTGNTPTASVSATDATDRPAIFISGDGSLQTVNKGSLTLGGGNSGNIVLGNNVNANNKTISSAVISAPELDGIVTTTGLTLPAYTAGGNITLSTHDIVTDTSTGTKFGTATTQKIGFYNAAPIVQPSGNALTALSNLGLISSPTLTSSDVGLGSVENTALSTWAGSTNLTTLGTITSGTWHGTAITYDYGGTGFNSYAQGDLIYASATNTLSKMSITGTSGQCLTSNGTVPSWGSCGGGSSNWYDVGGALFPTVIANDLLLGGSATTAARFAVLGIKTGNTPTASVSATDTTDRPAIFLSGDGSLQTVNKGALTIGTGQTGDLILTPGSGKTIKLGATGSINGGLTFLNSGASSNATITTDSSGNLILSTSQSGASVQVGSGNGNISLSLSNQADVLIADKTVSLGSTYAGNDFTFKRVLTGGANNQGGSILYVSDTSGGSGTINPDLILGNAALTSGTFTGNLLRLQLAGVDQVVASSAGVLVANGLASSNFAPLTIGNSQTGDITVSPGTGKKVNFLDGSIVLKNTTDTTKKVTFDLSGITGGNSRAWAFPDFSDTFVGLTGTQAITGKTYNGLTLTSQATGFTIAGGTSSKTLTVSDSTTLNTNSITLAGGEVITFTAANALTLATTGTTSVTLPTGGTLLTNTASAVQTVTSTQSTGTVLGITDSTALTGAITGLSITLSGTNAQDQTGLSFNLSGATGTNLNDIVGTGSTWKVSKAGALTVSSCSGCGGGGGAFTIDASTGVTRQNITTTDFLLGATSTASAKFAVTGLANSTGAALTFHGSATIGNNTTGDDVFKRTTTDFTQSGYSVTQSDGVDDVSTSGNQISLVTDLLGAGAATASAVAGPSTVTTVATAAFSIQRADGRFLLITGGGGKLYDPVANTFSGGPAFTTGTVGAGATGFQRADGNFMIIKGGGTATQIYAEASANEQGTFTAGPVTSAAVGAGSDVIRRTDGKVLVVHGGGLGSTSVYDPVANTFSAGPTIASAGTVTTGSFQFALPNGKWIVALGGSTTTNLYDPSTTGTGGGGTFSAGPALSASSGAGAHTIQLPDGRTLVILGGSTGATSIYDPTANTFSAGPTLASSQTVGAGGHSFQNSNGTWTVVLGGGSGNVQIYSPSAGSNGTFITAAALPGSTTAGAGAHTLQRPDGMYVIVQGNSSTNTTVYDGGWNTSGTWTSEDINSTKLSTYSTITWSDNPQSANNNARLDKRTIIYSVKTASTQGGLSSASWIVRTDSGDLIKSAANAAWVKIQVSYSTPVRSYPEAVSGNIFQRNIWAGEGEAFYRRTLIQPTTFSLKIQNPLVAYGDLSGATDPADGRNFATAGATLEGVYADSSNRITLTVNRNLPTAAAGGGIIIASASASLGATAGNGTHVIQLSNGQFIVIIGGTATTRLYDSSTGLFSAGPALPNTAGAGAHSFLMPDGRFFTVLGNSGTNTAIYDPTFNTFSAGPALFGNVGAGASSFQRPDGLFVIVNGGATSTTEIFDPITVSMHQGPNTFAAVGTGSFNMRRPDGRFIVMSGGGTVTTSSLYDPVINSFTAGPSFTTGSVNSGSTSVQMPNGKFWVKTLTTLSQVYDPYAGTFAVGPTANGTIGAGGVGLPRPDGKIVYMAGTASTIIDTAITVAGVTGPVLPCTMAAGGTAFQLPTGEYMIICGGGASTFIADLGWNLGGTYTSEQIYEPSLSSNTAMYWKNDDGGNIYVKYRTAATQQALGLASWQQLPNSGSNITITSGDVWFQTRIDLEGTLDDLPGAKTRVWLASDNGGMVQYYRQVNAPILDYWKLTNDSTPTILTLTSNSDNIFRFTADGQAFTSDNGAWNSGGADLAERYTSTQTLDKGEVVVSDPLHATNVIASSYPYQSAILGVVSTQPGFVAGAYTPNSYPIALVGRVPVKISTENGMIHSGDPLTSSSIKGYAMKATYAGRILGYAIENFDPVTQGENCPKQGLGNLPTTQCGSITGFINLTNYGGENVSVVMNNAGNPIVDGAISANSDSIQSITQNGMTVAEYSTNQQILNFLRNANKSGSFGSEVFTGRVSATGEIISPTIFTDLLVAKKIKADSIEGLDILVNNLTIRNDASSAATLTQEDRIASLAASIESKLSSASTSANNQWSLSSQITDGLASGSLRVRGNGLFEGILNVIDTITTNNFIVNGLSTFFGDTIFKGNTAFEGRPTFNVDTAGFAKIKKGDRLVIVTFAKPYESEPSVQANIFVPDMTSDLFTSYISQGICDKKQDSWDDCQAKVENNVIQNVFLITKKSPKGFTILLQKDATADTTFSWTALSIKDAKVFDASQKATVSAAFNNN